MSKIAEPSSNKLKRKAYQLLWDKTLLDNCLNALPSINLLRKKDYQVLLFKTLTGGYFGVIVYKQDEVINIFENSNQNLGRILMEVTIKKKNCKGSKPNTKYINLQIGILDILKYSFEEFRRFPINFISLGHLMLLGIGIHPNDIKEPHHILHAMLNLMYAIENIDNIEHGHKNARFKTKGQAKEYFKTKILCTDDKGLERFNNNIRILSSKFCTHRGIDATAIDLINTDLSEFGLDLDKVVLSKL